MSESNSVITRKDYGRVQLRLREYLDARGMNRNQLARASQANFAVIDKWYNGNVEKLDLDVLARICYVLDCEVSDLLVYEKTEE